MNIISRHHDYYDSALAEGQDRSLVYLRECVQFTAQDAQCAPQPLRVFLDFANHAMPQPYSVNKPGRAHDRITVSFGLILFAGKLHPAAEVRRWARGEVSPEAAFWQYDVDALSQLLAAHDVDIDDRSKKRRRGRFGDEAASTPKTFFALDGDNRLSEHATVHQLPVLSFAQSPFQLSVNPCLRDFQFYRRIGPREALQELSMFIGNIAAPDRVPLVVEEKYRVLQHGFDRQSFRKRPSAD